MEKRKKLEGKELIVAALKVAVSYIRALEATINLDKEIVRKKIGILKAALKEAEKSENYKKVREDDDKIKTQETN